MKKLIMLLFCFALIGCSARMMPKHYYRLTSSAQSAPTVTIQKKDEIIWVAPVSIAGYLDQEGLIYQTKPFEYVAANNHLWASPLAGQLQDSLVNNLASMLPHHLVSSSLTDNPKMVIKVFIDGFHGTYQNDIIIKGYWLIGLKNDKILRKNFNHRVAQHQDGYDALVEALSISWQSEINAMIKKVKL